MMNRKSLLIALALLAATAAPLHAQFPLFRERPEPGSGESYSGYWSPQYQPPGWKQPLVRIVIQNSTPAKLEVFHLDRWGRWNWAGKLFPGTSAQFPSPVGDLWNIRAGDDIVERLRAEYDGQVARIGFNTWEPRPEPSREEPRRMELTFRNRSDRDADLYSLTVEGRWIWVAKLPRRHGEIQVRSWKGQRWVAIDDRRRTVKDLEARHDDDIIVIK